MKVINSFFLLLLICILTSCSDSTTPTTSNGGGGLTGTLKGQILSMVDSNGKSLSNKNGVLIKAEGTPYSATSDNTGFWEIHDLPTGTYTFSFSKPGYFTVKEIGYSFVGGGLVRFTGASHLVQKPFCTVTIDGLAIPQVHSNVTVYSHFSQNMPDSSLIHIRYLFGRSPNLDITNSKSYISSYKEGGFIFTNPDSVRSATTPLNYQYMGDFVSGDTVFVRGYPYYGEIYYFDPQTWQDVFVGDGEGSNVIYSIVP